MFDTLRFVQTSAVLQQLLKTSEQQAAVGMAKARTKPAEIPSLGNLFHVGQLVRCTVEDLQDGDTPRQGVRRPSCPLSRTSSEKVPSFSHVRNMKLICRSSCEEPALLPGLQSSVARIPCS